LRSGYTESEYMSNGGRFVAACW